MNGDVIPVVYVIFRRFYEFEFLLGVIYQCAKLFLFAFAYVIAKELVDLALDIT